MAAPVTRAVSLLVNAGIQTALAMSTVTTPEFIQEWRWEGWTTGNETANGGAVDFDNNVIIVGGYGFAAMLNEEDDTFTETYASDFGAVKLLGSSGEVVWTWTASSADDEADVLFTVDTDSNSDIIMGGYSEGVWAASNPHTVRHLVVVKLDGSTGEELWRYQEASQDSTSATITYYGSGTVIGLAVDGDDNVILVGQTYNSLVDGEGDPGDSDYFALKLDGTDGGEVWRMQGGFSFHFDSFLSVKVDSAGDVVAVGITGSEGVTDFLAVKLGGTDGSFLWEYSPYSSTIDVLHAVDFDGEDNLFVAGGEDAPSLLGQVAETPIVIKLNGTTGDVMWAYEGTAISRTVFLSVAVDPTTGWVVGAGITEGTWVTGDAQGNYDFAAVVLDGDTGDELGRYQNGTTGVDSIKFAEFDSVGALFFGGYSLDVSGDQDFVAIKLAPLDSIPLTPAPLLLSSTPVPTSAFLTPTSNPESPTQAPEAPGTSSPISANTPSPSAAAPTPAPTSEEAGAPALAQWEVGAIAAGGSLLLLLLALCILCFRRGHSKATIPAGPPGTGSPRLIGAAVSGFGPPAPSETVPARHLPSYRSAVHRAQGNPDPEPPLASGTPSPPPPIAPPPYVSPPRPPPGEHISGTAAESEEEEPPSYEEIRPPQPADAVRVETALQRLANRVVRVPSNRQLEQNYRDIPTRSYGPYGPAANAL